MGIGRIRAGTFIILLCCQAAFAGEPDGYLNCKVRVDFSSHGSIGETVLEEIRQTKSRLALALFGFNNQVLARALVKLARQGVAVTVKIDRGKSKKKKQRRVLRLLRDAGIPVRLVGEEGKNHNKFAVIDSTRVITGSYNWTARAEQNWENLLVLDCPELARMYEREWEKIR